MIHEIKKEDIIEFLKKEYKKVVVYGIHNSKRVERPN